jgi:hypothetical protein
MATDVTKQILATQRGDLVVAVLAVDEQEKTAVVFQKTRTRQTLEKPTNPNLQAREKVL